MVSADVELPFHVERAFQILASSDQIVTSKDAPNLEQEQRKRESGAKVAPETDDLLFPFIQDRTLVTHQRMPAREAIGSIPNSFARKSSTAW